ncbi:hypothetical protein Tco_0287579 [Tanacetum coccineum]
MQKTLHEMGFQIALNEEIDKHEIGSTYSYMAKIKGGSPDESSSIVSHWNRRKYKHVIKALKKANASLTSRTEGVQTNLDESSKALLGRLLAEG